MTAVSATDGGPVPDVDTATVPAAQRRRHGSGFWAVAFAFLIVMAVATLPSPCTASTEPGITSRPSGSPWSSRSSRAARSPRCTGTAPGRARRAPGHDAWFRRDDDGGHGGARSVEGPAGAADRAPAHRVPVGLAAGTAVTYLVELRLRADPNASAARARTIGTSFTVGALGVGPLIAGGLAQWVREPLTVPYLVFIAHGWSLAGLWTAPETGGPAPRAETADQPASPGRKVRLPVPAAAGTWPPSPRIACSRGCPDSSSPPRCTIPRTRCPVPRSSGLFACGVVSQLATTRLPASRVLALGTISMLVGLLLLVVSVRLSTPSLALFLIAGCADRRGFWRGLQGDHRDRARGKPAAKPRRDDVGLGVVISGWVLPRCRP